MWRDICIANAARLRADLAAYRQELERIDAMLARGDGTALSALFQRAGAARAALLSGRRGGGDVE
jgi:prephenate dehydrogenase